MLDFLPLLTTFTSVQADHGRLYLPILWHTAAVHFTKQPDWFCSNSRSGCWKQNRRCWLSPGGTSLCYKLDDVTGDRCVQNKTSLSVTKHHANWFRHFECVGLMQWPCFWHTLYTACTRPVYTHGQCTGHVHGCVRDVYMTRTHGPYMGRNLSSLSNVQFKSLMVFEEIFPPL